jgi:Ras-related protein Rab-18
VQGIIHAYDVTRRETFESIQETWMKEVAENSNVEHAVKMLVANKVDRDSEREISRQEGTAFAKANGCLFVETSAKANTAVTHAFEELVRKIMETPELLETPGQAGVGKQETVDIRRDRAAGALSGCSC